MTASDLLALISTGTAPTILDVRSRVEYEGGHVPGARHVPFWKLLGPGVEVPASPDDLLVVYCGHGPRAQLASAALHRRGFRRVEYLEGHMSVWRRARLPEEK
ncbi:MAG TPA: rhodanese-like domain-containing protein [Vicinamibacterales bacterium]|jgi:hydroxyacylglutathione hydrolase|nr:rhodanese-like domain-containing protein [Vicinamibacterales bacterium]